MGLGFFWTVLVICFKGCLSFRCWSSGRFDVVVSSKSVKKWGKFIVGNSQNRFGLIIFSQKLL